MGGSVIAYDPTCGSKTPPPLFIRKWLGGLIILWAMSAGRKSNDHPEVTKELVVSNKLGVHARPAALFVKTANRFDCEVFVEKDGEVVNGKSIMGMMMLAAGPGSKLHVHAKGDDALQAVHELEALMRRKFDED